MLWAKVGPEFNRYLNEKSLNQSNSKMGTQLWYEIL